MFRIRLSNVCSAMALIASLLSAASTQAALVAYYPLDGNLTDIVGGYNGTASGDAFTYVAGQVGQAVDLNGSNQYATLTTGTNLGLGGNFTVAAFINSDNLGGDHTVLGNDGGADNQTLHLITRGSKAHLGFYSNDQGGNTTLSTATWTHVAYQFENGTQRIYVNGVLDASSGGHAAFAGGGNNVLLGRWNSANYFDGRIDNLAVYSNALALNQINYLAGGGSPQSLPAPVAISTITWDFGDTPNLQGWTVLNGQAFFRSEEGGGITAGNNGGFAHDPSHPNFLVSSPTLYFTGATTLDGINAITADFRGGQGQQAGSSTANFPTPASVINNNGGITHSVQGVKALGIYDINAGQYLAYLLDPGDADNGGTIVGLTPTQLTNAGVQLNGSTPYRLDFFDNDDGGWGWTQLNTIQVIASLVAVPEPASAGLAMLGLGLLFARRARRN